MLYAYCDESYGGDLRTTPVYVVAGFIARAHQWERFETLWRESMKDLRISGVGCHASKCAVGVGPYRDMSTRKRYEIQHRLIVDIVAAELFGVAAVVDMTAYRAHRDELFRLLPKRERPNFKPHTRAVGQCILQMCNATAKVTSDPIAFVGDQHAEGGGVKAAFDITRRNPSYPWRNRLKSYTEASRLDAVGLQAADMLAYAAFRFASGKPGWQWKELRPAIALNIMRSNEKFWAGEVRSLKARMKE